jgi:uncharacterized RDD family membrane protein YckC
MSSTDLIDVGDIPTEFDDEFTDDRGADVTAQAGADAAEGPTIATLSDRFAALFVDAAFLYAIYWLIMPLFRAIAIGTVAGPIPASGVNGLIFNSIFLLIAFLWFTIFEFAFGGSVGKLLCHLTVRKIDGGPITLGGAILRNLLRPIDIVLAVILVPVACMEWSAWHRRLGDFAGGTLVIKRLGRAPMQFALSLDMVASTSRRAIAFAIDLALMCAFAFGYALLLTPKQPVVSMILTVFSPLALIAFFALPEWLVHTSPGKWIFGLTVCHEDGTASQLPTALVRTLWRVYDTNPFGFLTSLMGMRKQRPGDAAAGSLVVNVPREWKGAMALAAVVIVTAAISYAGLQNRTSFLHSDFEINFLPSIDIRGAAPDTGAMRQINLGINDFRFAAGSPDTARKPAIFQPGETLYMVFDVGGYAVEDGGVWIQEDLSIRYPDDTLGLKLENINDFKQQLSQEGFIRFENNIALPEKSLPGRYTVTMTLRDKYARREVKEQRFFYITPPDSGGMTAPGDEAPDEPDEQPE